MYTILPGGLIPFSLYAQALLLPQGFPVGISHLSFLRGRLSYVRISQALSWTLLLKSLPISLISRSPYIHLPDPQKREMSNFCDILLCNESVRGRCEKEKIRHKFTPFGDRGGTCTSPWWSGLSVSRCFIQRLLSLLAFTSPDFGIDVDDR